MSDRFAALPTEPEQRISRLYCWVCIHHDGSEGILSAGTLPLVSSKRRLAEGMMRTSAERALKLSQQSSKPGARIELRIFDQSGRDERGG